MLDVATVCLSFDLDWATEPMLEHLYERLEPLGLPATLFVTHDSPMVRRLLTLPGCEAGLHPDFLRGGDPQEILSTLHEGFPDALGVRAHGLYYHSGLLALYRQRGLRFLSTDLRLLHPGIEPFVGWGGLVRLPIYWEDDVHCACMGESFRPEDLRLEEPGLKVLNVHPVHLYLNTRRLEDYQAVKERVRDPAEGPSCQRPGEGIDQLFQALAPRLRQLRVVSMASLAAEVARRPPPHRRRRAASTAETS